jgi:hypothetical protein
VCSFTPEVCLNVVNAFYFLEKLLTFQVLSIDLLSTKFKMRVFAPGHVAKVQQRQLPKTSG